MIKLKLAYFGTPDFSAQLLEKILTDKTLPIILTAIVTQPNKPVGRKKEISPSPVKLCAQKYLIPVYEDVYAMAFSQLSAFDMCLVYAYGSIIPAQLLSLPKHGFWNIHPSLLPLYRGPSPITYPLFLGDMETGVTLIKMDQQIDHGLIIAQEKIPISKKNKKYDLEKTLTNLAFEIVKKTIVQLVSTNFAPLPLSEQDHSHATYTHLLTKEHGFVALEMLKKALDNEPLIENQLPSVINAYITKYPHEKINFLKRTFNFSILIFNLYRAFYPWPGIWTKMRTHGTEKRLKLTNLSFDNNELHINTVQLEGKKEVDFVQFNKVYKILSIKA